jgi:DNA-binding MarR family transcriptional regulator
MDEQQQILRIANSFRGVTQCFYQATRKDAEASGLTPIQFLVLRMLKQYPQIGLTELSDLMHKGASTTSGVVDRLVHAGLIIREKPETDKRAVILHLTPKGEDLLNRTNERLMRRLSPLLQLSDDDVEHLLRIHQQIIHILLKAREEL